MCIPYFDSMLLFQVLFQHKENHVHFERQQTIEKQIEDIFDWRHANEFHSDRRLQ